MLVNLPRTKTRRRRRSTSLRASSVTASRLGRTAHGGSGQIEGRHESSPAAATLLFRHACFRALPPQTTRPGRALIPSRHGGHQPVMAVGCSPVPMPLRLPFRKGGWLQAPRYRRWADSGFQALDTTRGRSDGGWRTRRRHPATGGQAARCHANLILFSRIRSPMRVFTADAPLGGGYARQHRFSHPSRRPQVVTAARHRSVSYLPFWDGRWPPIFSPLAIAMMKMHGTKPLPSASARAAVDDRIFRRRELVRGVISARHATTPIIMP